MSGRPSSRNHREQLKVAVLQLTSTDSIEKNLKAIWKLLKKIEKQKADLVCLPENSLYFKIHPDSKVQYFHLKEPFWMEFRAWCRKNRCDILFGSVPVQAGKKYYNASVAVTAHDHQPVYSKIHLFDVDVKGAPPVRESDTFDHGLRGSTIEVKGWKIGLSICYDIRFSSLYLKYAKEEVDLILIPSAFLVPTGEAHWHVLNRARAIESQAYVISAAQAGRHRGEKGGERATYGHSLCVDPWGRILEENHSEGPGAFVVTLEREQILKVRAQIPMAGHRRL